jgi:hypothetical protein
MLCYCPPHLVILQRTTGAVLAPAWHMLQRQAGHCCGVGVLYRVAAAMQGHMPCGANMHVHTGARSAAIMGTGCCQS